MGHPQQQHLMWRKGELRSLRPPSFFLQEVSANRLSWPGTKKKKTEGDERELSPLPFFRIGAPPVTFVNLIERGALSFPLACRECLDFKHHPLSSAPEAAKVLQFFTLAFSWGLRHTPRPLIKRTKSNSNSCCWALKKRKEGGESSSSSSMYP